MPKPNLLLSLLLVVMIVWPTSVFAKEEQVWRLFKERFIQDDGRVIDRMNNGNTHSESVGYALVFALHHDDWQTFEKVYGWLHDNLKKNEQGLYGWHWGEREDGSWGMLDMNNATDGDMWIARALILAHQKKKKQEYLDEALELLAAIRQHLIYQAGDGTYYLLPGGNGFAHGRMLTLNPSYLILHLFRIFARYDDEAVWNKLYDDSKVVLAKGRFGRFQIHPDWLHVDADTGAVRLFPHKPFFSYDAVRVPLFLLHARKMYHDKDLDALLAGYFQMSRVFAEVGTVTQPLDLIADNLSLVEANAGFKIIFAYVAGNGQPGRDGIRSIRKELENEEKDYYSFSLFLFTEIISR